jgi:23S rRNA pseudouridine2457 synthase
MVKYYAIFKPYGMLSQFTKEGDHQTLADFGFKFPSDVYPVGRLDADSEGLLLMTNDTRVNSKLLMPAFKHTRKYLVQVEGEITDEAIRILENGISLNEKGKIYKTLPAKVSRINPEIPDRNPPIRVRKNIPTCWIEVQLVEGKNRQVRKMTAAAGFPALRLIRTEIEKIKLEQIVNGWIKEYGKEAFYRDLMIKF